MSLNKDAYTRYRVIDKVLVNRKQASLAELRDACVEVLGSPVSERTIVRDIENMRYDSRLNWNAPIAYDHAHRKYYYRIKGYSIERLPLNEEEVESLMYASRMLEQFRKVDILENVEGAVQKIADHLRIRKDVSDNEISEYIDFEKVPEMKGSEFLGPLLNAIMKKKVLALVYQGFDKPRPYTHTFHPYLLKEYRNRWYVFGYNAYWGELRTYALDRIKSLSPKPMEDYREAEHPPREYFRNIIGITRFDDSEPTKIILKFSKQQAPYILTQPLHESQQIIEKTDDYTIISLNVHPSPELEILLLGWHSEVEVLEPAEMRERVKFLSEKANNQYL